MNPADPSCPFRVFVSYSHDSPDHMDRVLALSDRLRHDGIDTDLDQYEAAPPEGWPRWTMRQVETADYVLVVCTEAYRRRFDGAENEKQGFGVRWEGAILTQILYDASAVSGVPVPVIFRPEDAAHIPTILRGVSHYNVGGREGYEGLYRYLTKQLAAPKPSLGPLRPFPPKPRTNAFPVIPKAARQVTSLAPAVEREIVEARRPRWRWFSGALLIAVILLSTGYLFFKPSLEKATVAPASAPAEAKQLLRIEIVDAETGKPLGGVKVQLPDLNLEQLTDPQGQYRFELNLPIGAQVRMRASKDNYEVLLEDPSVGTGLNTFHLRRKS